MDSQDELIREIAVKHGIAISRDDPVMVMQTINHRLMQDSSIAQQALLDRYKEELEELSHRWGVDAREKAERILTSALTASKETMDKEFKEETKAMTAAIRAEIDSALSSFIKSTQHANRVGIFNVVASCITLLAAGVSLWVIFR